MKSKSVIVILVLLATIGLLAYTFVSDYRQPVLSSLETKLDQPSSVPPQAAKSNPEPLINNHSQESATMSAQAVLKTSQGEITLTLYPDIAPKTVANFTAKAKSGYYRNLTFHRVEDWVIQGGDPAGNGTGGGQMPTELSNQAFLEGSLGVARGGDIRISNDSQFFICTKDCAWLTGQYTNFGLVTSGLDIAKQIQTGDKIISLTISDDQNPEP
jgi:peptidyl-prolyl cis-trans isomerase B (cyclophilin B)